MAGKARVQDVGAAHTDSGTVGWQVWRGRKAGQASRGKSDTDELR